MREADCQGCEYLVDGTYCSDIQSDECIDVMKPIMQVILDSRLRIDNPEEVYESIYQLLVTITNHSCPIQNVFGCGIADDMAEEADAIEAGRILTMVAEDVQQRCGDCHQRYTEEDRTAWCHMQAEQCSNIRTCRYWANEDDPREER